MIVGVCPTGAQVRRRFGEREKPLSSHKIRIASSISDFFNDRPNVSFPSVDGGLIAFGGANLRELRREIERLEYFANVIRVVLDMKSFENDEANSLARPLLVGEAVSDGSGADDLRELLTFVVGKFGCSSGASFAKESGEAVLIDGVFPLMDGGSNGFEGVHDFLDVGTVEEHLSADQTPSLLL